MSHFQVMTSLGPDFASWYLANLHPDARAEAIEEIRAALSDVSSWFMHNRDSLETLARMLQELDDDL
jgi:hypothetical protein